MREYFIRKTENLHRGRSKLVRRYGQWYFQRMTDAEFNAIEKEFVQVADLKGDK